MAAGLMLLPDPGYSQSDELERMTITPVAPPDEGIPVFRDHADKAAIIIESPMTNLSFESNMDGIVEDKSSPHEGRYVLIIEPFTQIIRVSAPGYIEGNFRVGSPEERDVLYYEIEPEERTPELISVIFNIEPEDAALYVDDQLTETNQTVQLTPGTHPLRIEREGYRSIEDMVSISPENIQFNYEMERIDVVPVQIEANVTGADVVIDGTERGQIDASGVFGLFLYPGTYALSVSSSGYVAASKNLEVTAGDENRFSVELERNIGELALDVTPSDATVELNREDYSDQDLVELAPGHYRLDVQKEGYAPYSEMVEVERDERLERSVSLEPYTGSLQFSVTPSSAQARLLDDTGETVENWQGINLLRDLKVGTYTLQVEAPEHLPVEETLQISRDETLEHQVSLTEGTPRERDTETEVVEVTNPETGRTWMDRNLGASRAATSSTDEQAYGELYQWGRPADGHQKRDSETTSTLSDSDQPGHGDFITSSRDANSHWRSPQNDDLWQGVNGINNPCPAGYRLPTAAEWQAERESWDSDDASGAFGSPLKLPKAGNRSFGSGSLFGVGSGGYYWTGSVSGSLARHLVFSSSVAHMFGGSRADGRSVRCLED